MSTKIKEVVFVKSNVPAIDPRLTKEMKSLSKFGYKIKLICWDREPNEKSCDYYDKHKNYEVKVLKLKAPYGIKIIPFWLIWWTFIFFQLLMIEWDAVHAINLDSIIPSFFAAKIKKKHIIYEMYDIYEDCIRLPNTIRNAFVSIDKIFMKYCNAVIVVDSSRIQELNGIPNENVIVIYNSSPDQLTNMNIPINNTDGEFIIFYAGTLNKNRLIEHMIEAIENVADIKLIIAGFGERVEEIKEIAKQNHQVEYIGKINYDEVMEYTRNASLLFQFYDTRIPIAKYASSNKLFEAMMFSKPIVVSKGTNMEYIVNRYECGIAVDCLNVKEIRDAIFLLKNDANLCKKLGQNGRKAYESIYSWDIMEGRLINIYHEISNE